MFFGSKLQFCFEFKSGVLSLFNSNPVLTQTIAGEYRCGMNGLKAVILLFGFLAELFSSINSQARHIPC